MARIESLVTLPTTSELDMDPSSPCLPPIELLREKPKSRAVLQEVYPVEELVDAPALGADVCSLVASSLTSQSSQFTAVQQVDTEQGLQDADDYDVSDNEPFVNWQERCRLELNTLLDTNNLSAESWNEPWVLAELAEGRDGIVFQQGSSFNVGSARASLTGPSRRLLRRSRARGGGDGTITSVLTVAEVSSQGWNTTDVELHSEVISGVEPPLRTLGRNNNLVGGILLHQVWHLGTFLPVLKAPLASLLSAKMPRALQMRGASLATRPCDSRFASLATHCADSTRADFLPPTEDVALGLDAFGQDAALNPYSPLFVRGNNRLLSDYYDTSEGTSDLTPLGFPLGFFPTNLLGLPPGFSVIFPVRFTIHLLQWSVALASETHAHECFSTVCGMLSLWSEFFGMQDGADAQTSYRMFQYLRDGHFVDARTQVLEFCAVVHNTASNMVFVWILRLKQLPSGSFLGRGSFSTTSSVGSGSLHELLQGLVIEGLAALLALLHALWVMFGSHHVDAVAKSVGEHPSPSIATMASVEEEGLQARRLFLMPQPDRSHEQLAAIQQALSVSQAGVGTAPSGVQQAGGDEASAIHCSQGDLLGRLPLLRPQNQLAPLQLQSQLPPLQISSQPLRGALGTSFPSEWRPGQLTGIRATAVGEGALDVDEPVLVHATSVGVISAHHMAAKSAQISAAAMCEESRSLLSRVRLMASMRQAQGDSSVEQVDADGAPDLRGSRKLRFFESLRQRDDAADSLSGPLNIVTLVSAVWAVSLAIAFVTASWNALSLVQQYQHVPGVTSPAQQTISFYHDLRAPLRMLLPARLSTVGLDAEFDVIAEDPGPVVEHDCNLHDSSRTDQISIDDMANSVPLWMQPADTSAWKTYGNMLVRLHLK